MVRPAWSVAGVRRAGLVLNPCSILDTVLKKVILSTYAERPFLHLASPPADAHTVGVSEQILLLPFFAIEVQLCVHRTQTG